MDDFVVHNDKSLQEETVRPTVSMVQFFKFREKQNEDGRWLMDSDYPGKTWLDFGEKKQPNEWVTLRALRVLKAVN